MPNWAEEMVAPVVGETNLFMQSCCMIRPATLIPTRYTGSPAGRADAGSEKSPVVRALRQQPGQVYIDHAEKQ